MKTFKTFLETVDKPKSPDEQAFVDKHIVSVSKHPVAGDDQFVSKNKKDKSKAASYKDGEDKDVYESIKEDVEQINELKKKTLANYVSKAAVDLTHITGDAMQKRNAADRDYESAVKRGDNLNRAGQEHKKERADAQKIANKGVKRMYSIDRALAKLQK